MSALRWRHCELAKNSPRRFRVANDGSMQWFDQRLQTWVHKSPMIMKGRKVIEILVDGRARKFTLAHLVLHAFGHAKPDRGRVIYKNGDKTDCSLTNLKWQVRPAQPSHASKGIRQRKVDPPGRLVNEPPPPAHAHFDPRLDVARFSFLEDAPFLSLERLASRKAKWRLNLTDGFVEGDSIREVIDEAALLLDEKIRPQGWIRFRAAVRMYRVVKKEIRP